MNAPLSTENQNTGHGHVFPRPDGMLARCGGPGMCAKCSLDLARKKAGEVSSAPAPKLTLVEWLKQLASTTTFNRETFSHARQAMRLAATRIELYEAGLLPSACGQHHPDETGWCQNCGGPSRG